MFFTHLLNKYARKQLVLHPPISIMPHALLPPLPGYVVDCLQIDLSAIRLSTGACLMKDKYFSFGVTSSFVGFHSSRLLHSKLGMGGEGYHFTELCKRKSSADESDEQFSAEKLRVNHYAHSVDNFIGEDDKEIQRRRRIGLANKGNVPWNKGRKHSEETREKIRQRTKEALNDPKVRKKMSECPRSLSNQTKARIRSSVRKLWGQRLKWKRSREKFLQSWAESIARAAKIGGSDQQELDWDSYDKMKTEMALQKLQWAAEKAKTKVLSRIQAERKVQEKAEKMAKLAQKRKEREEKAHTCGESKRKTNKKSIEEKEDLAVARDLKLKARLTKIHKKKTMISQLNSQHQRSWDKFDLEFIKKEQLQKAVSLEDQIRVAKNKRVEHATREALASSPSIYLLNERSSVNMYSN